MSERPVVDFALPTFAGLLVAAVALSAGCSNAPVGNCVYLSPGSSKSVASTQSDCENGCTAKMEATPGLITGCYFQPRVANPLEPPN